MIGNVSIHCTYYTIFYYTVLYYTIGCLNYKGLFLPHPTEDMLSQAAASNTDNDPIYQQIKKGGKGIEVGEALTATKVLDLPAWGFAKKVIDQQYFEL